MHELDSAEIMEFFVKFVADNSMNFRSEDTARRFADLLISELVELGDVDADDAGEFVKVWDEALESD